MHTYERTQDDVSQDRRESKSFLVAKKTSIRILVTGAKFSSGNARRGYDYGWWNLFDALKRFENIETLFFDYATQAQQRGIAGMSEYLAKVVNKEKPDLLFYIPTNLSTGVLPDSLQYMTSHADTQIVIWLGMHENLSDGDLDLYIPCTDFFITTSLETLQSFQKTGHGSKIIKSQWGFNPFTYTAEPSTTSRNISFCGTANINRSAILEKMKQMELPVDVFGSGWHDDSFIPFYDMIKIFNKSKVNLNLGGTADWKAANISRRIFEVPGCGGFLITTPFDHLEEFYEPGKEVVVVSSPEELIDKVTYYLAHIEEREKIARNGHLRTLSEHTWLHRLSDIFKHIGFKAVPRTLSQSVPSSANTFSAVTTDSSLTDVGMPSVDYAEHYGKMTTIWVMAFNQIQYTKQCVESILHYTKGPYEFLLVDHGSNDETFKYFNWIKSFHPDTRIIRYFQNRIIEETCNHIFCIARGKYLAVATNDTVVHEGWLENFIKHIEASPDIAVVGPRSNNISGTQILPTDYNTLEAYHTFAAEWTEQHRGENFPIERMVGMCTLTKKDVYYRIGGGDPNLPTNGRDGGYGFSDDDFTLRLRLGGYRSLVANDVFIHHYGSVTVTRHRPDLFGEPQNINKVKYIQKIQSNDRITIGADGKINIRPYSQDEIIPIDDRLIIRPPHFCFVLTNENDSKLLETDRTYISIVNRYNGEIIRCANKSIPDLFLNKVQDKHCDYLCLTDPHLAPAPEVVSMLSEYAICYPDVAVIVPVGNYAPKTHRRANYEKSVELIPYADLSVCVLNLKIIRAINAGLPKCDSLDDLFWFLQRHIRGKGYFIAKANDLIIKGSAPTQTHTFDLRKLPEQLMDENEFAQAITIFEDDLRKDPNFAYAYYQLARIAAAQKQTPQAVHRAEQALAVDPHHIETIIFLSKLFMEQNEWKKAAFFIGQAHFKQPGNPDVQKIVKYYEDTLKENPKILYSEEFNKIPSLTPKESVKNLTSIIVNVTSGQAIDCLAAIKKNTKEPYELIVIDVLTSTVLRKKLNKIVKEHRHHIILKNTQSTFFLTRLNQAINNSKGEYLVVLADDAIVTNGWLSEMLNCLNYAPDAGIVGPMTNNGAGMQQATDESYQTVNYLDKYALQYKERFRHRRIPCGNLGGFCMLFKRMLTEKIGLFDERFDTGQCEDEDFCIRAALAGYSNYIAGDVFLHRECKKAPCNRIPLEEKWTLTLGSPEGKKLALLKAVEYAELLHSKGNDDQAVEALINCIKFTPDTKEIYYELARIFIESKKFSEAWEVIGTMPEEAKSSIRGLELSGYGKEGMGLDNEAMDFADKILSSDRSNPSALNLKGILAFKKDQIKEAQDYFKRAIQSDPGVGEPYTNLGVLCWKMGKNEEALEHLRKGFILSPNVPDLCNIYYSVLSTSEEFRRAKDDFGEANRLYPHNKHIAFLYIDILIRQANLDEAMLKIEDALASFGPEEGLLNAALSVREKIGPRQIDPLSKMGTLSFCLIVKNEEKYLVNCLKSIRDIADEIIVVDTGSTDKTIDIAKVFGARLFDFPWIGDFSAARNRSLEEAKGDWIFVLDADEVLSSIDYEDLKAITGKRPASPAAYLVNTRNYLTSEFVVGRKDYDGKYPEESRQGWLSSGKVRLFTRREDVFFVNPVHELLEPSIINARIPLYNCNIAVHHYGKMDSSKDAQKGEEYYLMGKIKCENEPNNVRYIIELAKQAQLLSKNEEALGLFRKALALLGDDRESPVFKDVSVFTFGDPISELQAYVAASCLHLNRFEEALEASRKSMKTDVKLKEYITIYAQCEILAGSLDTALSLVEEQLQITPDYVPAIIFKAAVLSMEGKKEEIKELSQVMLQNRNQVTAVFNVLTMKLHQNNMRDKALRLAATAFDNQIITEETHNILQLLDEKLSSQTCQ